MSHQIEAIDSLNKYFNLSGKKKGTQNGLLVMLTGSGKTFTAVNWVLKRIIQFYKKIEINITGEIE